MEVQIAAAKTNKYAVTESGDTLEVVERPNGGLSVVLADGQTSGRGRQSCLDAGGAQGDRPAGRRGAGRSRRTARLPIHFTPINKARSQPP